ncbi:MAG: M4 family metallopeptidase [Acidobacteriota bacterium]
MKKFSILIAACLIIFFAVVSMYSGVLAMGKVFGTNSPQEQELARSLSLQYLEQRLGRYGISSIDDLKIKSVEIDELGMAHTRVQQTFNGVPVFGGEGIVHLTPDGSVASFTDAFIKNVRIDTIPKFTQDEAVHLAVADFGCEKCLTALPQADLLILNWEGRNYLVYRVQLEQIDYTKDMTRPIYFLDAHTGNKIMEYENLQHQATTGTGNSLYSDTLTGFDFRTFGANGTFYLENHTEKVNTVKNSFPYYLVDANNNWGQAGEEFIKPGVDAHYGAAKFFQYMLAVHNRNGLNGNGGPGYFTSINGVTKLDGSAIHCGQTNNASWTGNFACLGDGASGNTAFVSIDIVGHELMHGVIQFMNKLTYIGESGALNENMADVFGSMTERFENNNVEDADTFVILEDAIPFFPPGLRFFADPHMALDQSFTNDDQPDHFSERYICDASNRCTPESSNDNGGVHINSGIANKAFHLLAKGGSHHLTGAMVPAAGIGTAKAEKIWYRALKNYMTLTTNFAGARAATLNAAADLYGTGSVEHTAVGTAWSKCGVN